MRSFGAQDKATSDTTKPAVFHVAQFDYSDQSSISGHPEMNVCTRLAGWYVAEGFRTVHEHLWLTPVVLPSDEAPNAGPVGVIPAFSLGYVQGSARVITLMAIVAMIHQDELSLKEVLWIRHPHPTRQPEE